MSLITLKEILEIANRENYAVAAFDVMDHASAEAIIASAEALKKPVVVMFPETGANILDVDKFFPFLVDIAKNAKIPVALELDHGKSLEGIMKAISHGFSSVMIDGSALPYEKNVELTRKIVEIAHAANVSVEGEIGHVTSAEGTFDCSDVDESMYTNVEDAEFFTKDTGVDALAIAFGTVHGVFKGVPRLDFVRLQEIKNRVSVPLVMHGGSGVGRENFIKAVECGISKINIFTEISMSAVSQSIAYSQKKENKIHFAEMILVGKKAVSDVASDYIQMFSQDTPI